MNIEKFIILVYGHKCLWDQSDPSYHLRVLQRRAWREISVEMEISVDDLKKKWRGLRDTFGKELKKLNIKSSEVNTKPDSKWQYFKFLLFLRDTMSQRDLKSELDTCETSDEKDSANASTSSNNTPSPLLGPSSSLHDKQNPKKAFKLPVKKKIKRDEFDTGQDMVYCDYDTIKIEEEKCCQESSTNDPDAQFLMSLLPFLKDIPKHRKLMVRSKLQQVLIDEQNAIYTEQS